MGSYARSNQTMNLVGVAMVAAAAGALAGMLFAPKKGSEMRGDINRRMVDMKGKTMDKVSQGADTMKNKAQQIADKTRTTVSQTADKAKDTANSAADRTKSAANKVADAAKDTVKESAAETNRRSAKS